MRSWILGIRPPAPWNARAREAPATTSAGARRVPGVVRWATKRERIVLVCLNIACALEADRGVWAGMCMARALAAACVVPPDGKKWPCAPLRARNPDDARGIVQRCAERRRRKRSGGGGGSGRRGVGLEKHSERSPTPAAYPAAGTTRNRSDAVLAVSRFGRQISSKIWRLQVADSVPCGHHCACSLSTTLESLSNACRGRLQHSA